MSLKLFVAVLCMLIAFAAAANTTTTAATSATTDSGICSSAKSCYDCVTLSSTNACGWCDGQCQSSSVCDNINIEDCPCWDSGRDSCSKCLDVFFDDAACVWCSENGGQCLNDVTNASAVNACSAKNHTTLLFGECKEVKKAFRDLYIIIIVSVVAVICIFFVLPIAIVGICFCFFGGIVCCATAAVVSESEP